MNQQTTAEADAQRGEVIGGEQHAGNADDSKRGAGIGDDRNGQQHGGAEGGEERNSHAGDCGA